MASKTLKAHRLPCRSLTSPPTHGSCQISDLPALEDWDAFKPNMKGSFPHKSSNFGRNASGLRHEQIVRFIRPRYMRDNDAPFIASSVLRGSIGTRLTICGETFTIPASSREMIFLTTHLGNNGATRHTVPKSEVKILDDAGHSSISESHSDVLRNLKVVVGGGTRRAELMALDVFKAGSHQLSTAPTNLYHFATIFVLLPPFSDPTSICAQATHDGTTQNLTLPTNLSQCISAIGVYAGVSDACIDVGTGGAPCFVPRLEHLSGPLVPLRDAFCAWRYGLNTGNSAPSLILLFLNNPFSTSAAHFGRDATLLCHLSPLAKAYGFKIYLLDVVHTRSTKQEIEHPYKEYIEVEDMNRSQLYMSKNAKVKYKWEDLRTLGGQSMTNASLLSSATRMLKTSRLQKELLKLDLDKNDYDIEVEDDSPYFSTVIYKHIRSESASILFIASEESFPYGTTNPTGTEDDESCSDEDSE
ncbi:hypothetical protein K438DRAFT_1969459 [Mycena galopus ATCC 62051]|nr:hypothetical protein K438DRAFT_1969459 [Mycena galopus ATCC 62051]